MENQQKMNSTFERDAVGYSNEILQNTESSQQCKYKWCDFSSGVPARITEGPGIYYMGIIDMLQEWNFWKKAEHFLKTKFLWKDPKGLSAIAPNLYQKRFMDRMYEIIKDEANFLSINNVDVTSFRE